MHSHTCLIPIVIREQLSVAVIYYLLNSHDCAGHFPRHHRYTGGLGGSLGLLESSGSDDSGMGR